ncbi:MAG: hypothetical protein WBC44_07170 [Planctomycetaceae bacterium]
MAFLGTRLSIYSAVALVTVAQIVAAPAACCVLKSAVFGGEPCCHRQTVTVESPSCCRQRSPDVATSDVDSDHTPVPEDCVWCSAGPKIGSPDRVTPPSADVADLAVAETRSAADASLASQIQPLDEPAHRAAQATCAWLCVWRK